MRVLLCRLEISDADITAALPADARVFHAADAEEMLACACDCLPDIVLVDGAMPGLSSALGGLDDLFPLPVVIVALEETELTEQLPSNVYGILSHPFSPAAVRLTLDASCRLFQRVRQLRREISLLQDAFAARKVIERAKGLIMQRRMMTEAEAYRLMREDSRRQRITIAEYAAAILLDGPATPASAGANESKKVA